LLQAGHTKFGVWDRFEACSWDPLKAIRTGAKHFVSSSELLYSRFNLNQPLSGTPLLRFGHLLMLYGVDARQSPNHGLIEFDSSRRTRGVVDEKVKLRPQIEQKPMKDLVFGTCHGSIGVFLQGSLA
jgi:hypothetical protein